MQLATAWPGMPPDLCFMLLAFMVGTHWVETNRQDTLANVALATELRNKTCGLANIIRDLLVDAGLYSTHNLTPNARGKPPHPFEVLRAVYAGLPSLDTLSNLLVADLKYIKGKVLDKCRDRPVFWRYITRCGLWHDALGPALQLVVAMRQWHISGPPLNLVTPQEIELIRRLFEGALELGEPCA